MKYDVVIVGAGVVGCSVARFLSFYDLNVAVIEKEEDVCSGTSKANSAIVHAGHDAKEGTLKAKFNLLGSKMMEDLSKELDFSYKRNGSLVLCFNKEDLPDLEALYKRGINNGVEGLEILDGNQVREKEPNLSENVVAALWCPTGAIVCPFELTQAMAENAATNGTTFIFNTKVDSIERKTNSFVINKDIETKAIVNCAGLYSDLIHNMVCEKEYHIIPRKGDYVLMDREVGGLVNSTIFQLPTKMGKGVLVTPTVHGNLLVGPSATEVEDKDVTATTADDLNKIITAAKLSANNIPFNKTITSFSGVRAHLDEGDFIIDETSENFFDCLGIESPGLTAAPAIGKHVSELVAKKLNASLKDNYVSNRRGIVKVSSLNKEERAKLIEQNRLYGQIICRCEEISEGEIIDAIRRNPGAKSLDGIKRRVRAGMGRCQAGFCTPKVMEILSRELNINMKDVTKNNSKSKIVLGKMKED